MTSPALGRLESAARAHSPDPRRRADYLVGALRLAAENKLLAAENGRLRERMSRMEERR